MLTWYAAIPSYLICIHYAYSQTALLNCNLNPAPKFVLTAQQANSSRLVGRRLRTIYHRALSLSLVPHKWRRQQNAFGECHRWPSCNCRPGMEVPSRSVPWTPVWRSWTQHGVGLAGSVVLVEWVWYVHIDLCEWPAYRSGILDGLQPL